MKKNNAIGFFLLLGAACACAGCTRSNIANIDSPGTTIICLGDSITLGYNAQPRDSYPAVLAKMTSVPVINAGLEGDTTGQALKRLQNDVLDRQPLLVVIEFGANDLFSKIPFEETIANFEELIRRIQQTGAMVAIADISTPMIMERYGQEYKRLSKKHQTILITGILDGIIDNPRMRSDYIHPNARGYKLIAYRVYRGIVPYLNQNAILRKQKK